MKILSRSLTTQLGDGKSHFCSHGYNVSYTVNHRSFVNGEKILSSPTPVDLTAVKQGKVSITVAHNLVNVPEHPVNMPRLTPCCPTQPCNEGVSPERLYTERDHPRYQVSHPKS